MLALASTRVSGGALARGPQIILAGDSFLAGGIFTGGILTGGGFGAGVAEAFGADVAEAFSKPGGGALGASGSRALLAITSGTLSASASIAASSAASDGTLSDIVRALTTKRYLVVLKIIIAALRRLQPHGEGFRGAVVSHI